MLKLATYLINLDQSSERLARARAELERCGLEFQRVPAVYGKHMDSERRMRVGKGEWTKYFQHLSDGEVGCYLSHLRAIDAFLTTDADTALILEDDVTSTHGAASCIASLLMLGSSLPNAVNLAGSRSRGEVIAKLTSGHYLMRSNSCPFGTMAILWTREGAMRFRANAGQLTRPVDIDRKHWWERGLEPVWLHPAPFAEAPANQAPSTIHGRRHRSLVNRVRKAIYRLSFTIESHIALLRVYGVQAWLRALQTLPKR